MIDSLSNGTRFQAANSATTPSMIQSLISSLAAAGK